jgi:beta-lactamase superfamily II metal-dependent hydrolase
MAIPAGTAISFGETIVNVAQLLKAYCIDRGLDTPSNGSEFHSYDGTVRLGFANGSTQDMNFQEATKYIQIQGNGTFTSLDIKRKDPSVVSAKFLTHSIATEGSRDEAAQSFRIVSENFPKELNPDTSPGTIWNKYLFKETINRNALAPASAPPAETVLDYLRRDPTRPPLKQRVVNLGSAGDGIVITTPSGQTIVIDGGYTQGAFNQMGKGLNSSGGNIGIVSHTDRDHAGNVSSFLMATPFSELAISSYQSETAVRTDILKTLSDLKYTGGTSSSSPMSVYKSAPANAPPIGPQQLLSGFNREDLPFSFHALRLDKDKGVDVQLIQFREPDDTNESSIMVRVTHNGYSTLYAGDIDPTVMDAMYLTQAAQEAQFEISFLVDLWHRQFPNEAQVLDGKYHVKGDVTSLSDKEFEEYVSVVLEYMKAHFKGDIEEEMHQFFRRNEAKMVSFHADTLKWPHHGWIPKTPAEERSVIRFIKTVDPQRIVFSVGPKDLAGQDIEKVKAFLEKNFPDRHFTYYATRTNGDFVLLTVRRRKGNKFDV